MELSKVYGFLAKARDRMMQKDECLYNALVQIMASNAQPRVSDEYLLQVCDSLRELAQMIEDEVMVRQNMPGANVDER